MNERGRGGKGMRERRGGWPGRERQRETKKWGQSQ